MILTCLKDHELKFESKGTMTEEVINRINTLKGNVKTIRTLQNMINKEFNTDFTKMQIQYQISKLLIQYYGIAVDDAYTFVNLAEKDISENEGYFDYELNDDHTFKRSIYLSNTMLLYSEKFLDLVIIDSTYRRNRFNLILVNILGVSNTGKNITLGFALLSNETTEDYKYVFRNLKKAWKNEEPENFIIDESQAIQSGNLLLINLYIFRYYSSFQETKNYFVRMAHTKAICKKVCRGEEKRFKFIQ